MEAIKPRQIINYDAGIVLIDLHQLNVKQSQTIQISDTEYGATSCQRRTEPRTTTRNIRFPNQMIEQINIALEQKRVRESLSLVIEAQLPETNVRKERHIHQLKVMKNEHPAFFPPNRIILYPLNYEALQ